MTRNEAAQGALDPAGLLGRIRELVENSMHEAENFPIGGIGENGPTQADLDEAIENGHPVEDEATLHGAQQIWLNLKKIIDELPHHGADQVGGNV